MYDLRPVEAADAELLFRVYASTREEELVRVPWTPEQKSAFLRMQFAAQDAHFHARFRGASFDVVLVDGTPAGRLYVHRMANDLRIVDISLLSEFRGRGIGTALLSDVIAEADRDGKGVSLHVAVTNRARHLYERLGFQAVDEVDADAVVYLLMKRP